MLFINGEYSRHISIIRGKDKIIKLAWKYGVTRTYDGGLVSHFRFLSIVGVRRLSILFADFTFVSHRPAAARSAVRRSRSIYSSALGAAHETSAPTLQIPSLYRHQILRHSKKKTTRLPAITTHERLARHAAAANRFPPCVALSRARWASYFRNKRRPFFFSRRAKFKRATSLAEHLLLPPSKRAIRER